MIKTTGIFYRWQTKCELLFNPSIAGFRLMQGVGLIVATMIWSGAVVAQGTSVEFTDSTRIEDEKVPPTGTPGSAPGRAVKPMRQALTTGTPFQVGSFFVYPEVDVTYLYDNNVYFSNASTVSDHAMVVTPSIWVQSNWSQHALNFYAATDVTRYNNYSEENTEDYRISLEGRYDLSVGSNLYGGVRLSKDHEERESPDGRNGLTPTAYNQYRFYGGFFKQLDRWSLRIAGTAQQLDYRDVYFRTGGGAINIINNDDRDRWQYTGGVRVGYEVAPQLEPYAQIAFDNRRYVDATDDLGYRRNSDGERYLLGVKWSIPKTLKLDAFAGWINQEYDDVRLPGVSSPVLGAALLWGIAPGTSLSAILDRTVEETTVTQTVTPGIVAVSSSYLNTYLSVGVNHRLTEALSIRASGSLSKVDYQGINRNDDYYGVNIGMVYRISRSFFLDVDLSRRELKSSIPTEDFQKRVLFVRLAIPFSN